MILASLAFDFFVLFSLLLSDNSYISFSLLLLLFPTIILSLYYHYYSGLRYFIELFASSFFRVSSNIAKRKNKREKEKKEKRKLKEKKVFWYFSDVSNKHVEEG